jgi:hypothetical protein
VPVKAKSWGSQPESPLFGTLAGNSDVEVNIFVHRGHDTRDLEIRAHYI